MFLKMSCLREEFVVLLNSVLKSECYKASTEFLSGYHNRTISKYRVSDIVSYTGSQKKSPFSQRPSFERCFSTKSNADIDGSSTNKSAMEPMINLFTDLHSSKASSLQSNSKILPSMSQFPKSPSVSVSYVVGGFVANQNQASSSQNICDLFGALVNSFQSSAMKKPGEEPYPDIPPSLPTTADEPTMNSKRTYADVTKGNILEPNVSSENDSRPLRIGSLSYEINIYPNNMQTMYSTNNCPIGNSNLTNCIKHPNMYTISVGSCSAKSVGKGGTRAPSENPPCVPGMKCAELKDLIQCTSIAQHPLLQLPYSSLSTNAKMKRTVSECSVESDDSFVVFQSEEDAVYDSVSDEDYLSDDLDEVDHNSDSGVVMTSTLTPRNKTKKVSFKPDENLVEVHKIVTWDFAHRAARIGPWERYARDRARFENKIHQLSIILSPILVTSHRAAVYKERFLEKN